MSETVTAPPGRLRWGLLGAGNIARRFAMDLRAQGLAVAAVASRDGGRARAFAEAAGLPRYHASYDALLEDPEVDIVYVSLPNHLHAEWSARAAAAGKHVLCEKPAALDEGECGRVLEAVRRAGVFYMEGFMYRCHPLWGLVRALLEEDRIGEVRALHSSFCYDMGRNLSNIRQRPEAGGGALLDVGCYCLSFSRMLAGAEPTRCRAVASMGAESKVDESTGAVLEFPGGVIATFQCALRVPQPQVAVIYGAKGRLEIPSPWHPDRERARVKVIEGGREEEFLAGDGLGMFAREALDVAEHLDGKQSPSMSWEDSLGQARALGALRRSLEGRDG